jgi:hypothetical protein
MKYLSDCCKAEAIIRNNDISLCSKCHEECDALERVELKQTGEQKNASFTLDILFDADLMLTSSLSPLLRENVLMNAFITLY